MQNLLNELNLVEVKNINGEKVTIGYRTNRKHQNNVVKDEESALGGEDNSNNDDGEKQPPIVWLHGMASSSHTWLPTVHSFITAEDVDLKKKSKNKNSNSNKNSNNINNRTVIIPDLRGHCRSSKSIDYNLETLANDIVALLDTLNIDVVDIIGHSLGGYLSLTIASNHPHRVRRLVLEDTPCHHYPIEPIHNDNNNDNNNNNLETTTDSTTTITKISNSNNNNNNFFNNTSSPLRLINSFSMVKSMLKALWRGFDFKMSSLIIKQLRTASPEWWDKLSSVTATTLIIGASDSHIPTIYHERLAKLIPQSTLKVVLGGHHIHRDDSQLFNSLVIPFLLKDKSSLMAINTNTENNNDINNINNSNNNSIHIPNIGFTHNNLGDVTPSTPPPPMMGNIKNTTDEMHLPTMT